MPKKQAPKVEKKSSRSEQIAVRFNQAQAIKLDKICKIEKKTRAEVLRDAFDFYSNNHKDLDAINQESKLERRLASIENACRALMVKDIKLSAQNLYWLTLMWTFGPPKQKLNEQGFKKLWSDSEIYAAEILKSKKVYMDEPVKPSSPRKQKK